MNTKEEAIAKGFTETVLIDGPSECFEALIKPETDLDGRFLCYDLDGDTPGWVQGWLAIIHTQGEY